MRPNPIRNATCNAVTNAVRTPVSNASPDQTREVLTGDRCFRYREWGLFLMTVDRKATRRYAREEQQMSNELSSAEVPADPPIDLEILTAAWTATTGCGIDQIRAALVAALPALRRQIAEEIAEALDERHRSNLALSGGDKDYIPRDGRVGLATGYQRAAGIAREIGAQ